MPNNDSFKQTAALEITPKAKVKQFSNALFYALFITLSNIGSHKVILTILTVRGA